MRVYDIIAADASLDSVYIRQWQKLKSHNRTRNYRTAHKKKWNEKALQ